MLRASVDRHGMSHLVAKSGKEALQNTVLELEGREAEAQFDPLMSANNMIWARGLELGGMYLMGEKSDGSEYCPICEAIEHIEGHAESMTVEQMEEYWIDGPVKSLQQLAKDKGLIP